MHVPQHMTKRTLAEADLVLAHADGGAAAPVEGGRPLARALVVDVVGVHRVLRRGLAVKHNVNIMPLNQIS